MSNKLKQKLKRMNFLKNHRTDKYNITRIYPERIDKNHYDTFQGLTRGIVRPEHI